ncbi:MAG: hypothetical protein ABSH48_25185 [Verrucomicrobiota bacterium]
MNASNEFICPECGSHDASAIKMVLTGFAGGGELWVSVSEAYCCAQCNSIIPAQLAERWENLLQEEAQEQWCDTDRDSQPEWD